jgi:hypothetical protein
MTAVLNKVQANETGLLQWQIMFRIREIEIMHEPKLKFSSKFILLRASWDHYTASHHSVAISEGTI